MPERLSVASSDTVTASLTQPDGADALVDGGVRSIFTLSTDALVALPARSLTLDDTESPSPSPVIVFAGGQAPATPESASAHVHSTVTSSWYQPASLGLVVGAPLSVGGVVSTLISCSDVLAVLSALSVAVPVADWCAPSPNVCGPAHDAMPDVSSVQLKFTVTLALCQPLAFGALFDPAVIVGAVLSMLTVAVSVVALPALSVADLVA